MTEIETAFDAYDAIAALAPEDRESLQRQFESLPNLELSATARAFIEMLTLTRGAILIRSMRGTIH